jgi:ligand-binding SRPBCC domain-containing protein
MKIYTLNKQQIVARPLREVFAFFERPENLSVITPPWLGFSIMTPSPIPMGKGTVVDYSIRMIGLKVHWRSLISAYEPLRGFTDEQLIGPYAFWHHAHTFAEVDDGTLIADEIHYAMPFGVIGQVCHPFLVERRLEEIFRYRAQIIKQMFGIRPGIQENSNGKHPPSVLS